MDEQMVDENGPTDEDLDGPEATTDPRPVDEPDVFTGEVPPDEELAGSDPPPASSAAPVRADRLAGDGADDFPESRAQTPATPLPLDWPIKVVVTLRPGAKPSDPGSVLIAVGADGREPALRYLESADLVSALAAVPEVLAAALAAWKRRKDGTTSSRPASTETAIAAPTAEPSDAAPGQPAPQPAGSTRRARGGEPAAAQPSLFG